MGALDGQVAVVTGGTRGVGRAIAEAYIHAGATVVVNGRDRESGDAFVREHEGLSFHPGDVSDQATIEGLLDQAVQERGRIDVVVLNAGGPNGDEPVASISDDDWQRVLDLNLNHVFWGIRRALHHMLPRQAGRIVVTSAIEGKLPRPGASGYVAAKHAVNGLVKSVAREVGTQGIAVNAILPGPIDPATEHLEALSKLGRRNTVDEVARVAVLLASPSITSITGCLFPVDGGTMP
ncbi:MAG TPA: SDR family NAD(P)-dependent oxidoreductase, partial [Thermoleophilaceae bacterium]